MIPKDSIWLLKLFSLCIFIKVVEIIFNHAINQHLRTKRDQLVKGDSTHFEKLKSIGTSCLKLHVYDTNVQGNLYPITCHCNQCPWLNVVICMSLCFFIWNSLHTFSGYIWVIRASRNTAPFNRVGLTSQDHLRRNNASSFAE